VKTCYLHRDCHLQLETLGFHYSDWWLKQKETQIMCKLKFLSKQKHSGASEQHNSDDREQRNSVGAHSILHKNLS